MAKMSYPNISNLISQYQYIAQYGAFPVDLMKKSLYLLNIME